MISVDKPGSPEELVHFGVKGMKWGVRKAEETSSSSRSTKDEKFWTPERKATAKKVAIGAGILTAVAGASFVTYKLHQNGNLPLSSIKRTPNTTKPIEKTFQPPTDLIHLSGGKYKGAHFLRKGGTPDFFTEWENAFVKEVGNADTDNAFKVLSTGRIAAAFRDMEGRRDAAGRLLGHQIIIPNSMTNGINNIDDVKTKIWPLLKDAYDAMYKASEIDPLRA